MMNKKALIRALNKAIKEQQKSPKKPSIFIDEVMGLLLDFIGDDDVSNALKKIKGVYGVTTSFLEASHVFEVPDFLTSFNRIGSKTIKNRIAKIQSLINDHISCPELDSHFTDGLERQLSVLYEQLSIREWSHIKS